MAEFKFDNHEGYDFHDLPFTDYFPMNKVERPSMALKPVMVGDTPHHLFRFEADVRNADGKRERRALTIWPRCALGDEQVAPGPRDIADVYIRKGTYNDPEKGPITGYKWVKVLLTDGTFWEPTGEQFRFED